MGFLMSVWEKKIWPTEECFRLLVEEKRTRSECGGGEEVLNVGRGDLFLNKN